MTDLTAAQLVEQLRKNGWDKKAEAQAANLIEQQAEQIAALRKVIEDAPHSIGCFANLDGTRCNCWKSKALPEKDPA
jgi:hypothetical protein